MEKTSEGDENRETSIPRHCRLTRRSLLKSAAAVASAAILPSGLAATAFYFQSVFGTKSDSAKSKPSARNARKVTELTPGDLLRVASATEAIERQPDRGHANG